jgi:hypothetical protein
MWYARVTGESMCGDPIDPYLFAESFIPVGFTVCCTSTTELLELSRK